MECTQPGSCTICLTRSCCSWSNCVETAGSTPCGNQVWKGFLMFCLSEPRSCFRVSGLTPDCSIIRMASLKHFCSKASWCTLASTTMYRVNPLSNLNAWGRFSLFPKSTSMEWPSGLKLKQEMRRPACQNWETVCCEFRNSSHHRFW